MELCGKDNLASNEKNKRAHSNTPYEYKVKLPSDHKNDEK